MDTIRLMRVEDADSVRQVDAVAFGSWTTQVSGRQAPVHRRTRANVLACRDKDPEGCFVAEKAGEVVGFIFSRTWGGVGWFGTFAVLPEHQGRGLGKKLIAASLDYLHRDPGRLVGLETMFDSPYNLGLYLKLGFQAVTPTLLLTRTLECSIPAGADLERWSTAESRTQERWLADLRRATGQIERDLDYSKEIVSAEQFALGQTLILQERGRAIGFAVVWLTSGWEDLGEDRATVQVLALHPARTTGEAFGTLLAATEGLACSHGKNTLAVAVNASHPWALAQLLARGYRVSRAMVRMVLGGTAAPPSPGRCVDCSRWAG